MPDAKFCPLSTSHIKWVDEWPYFYRQLRPHLSLTAEQKLLLGNAPFHPVRKRLSNSENKFNVEEYSVARLNCQYDVATHHA